MLVCGQLGCLLVRIQSGAHKTQYGGTGQGPEIDLLSSHAAIEMAVDVIWCFLETELVSVLRLLTFPTGGLCGGGGLCYVPASIMRKVRTCPWEQSCLVVVVTLGSPMGKAH